MEAIRHAITKRLSSLYPDVLIYEERMEQGFSEPCFFVYQLSGGQAKDMGRRYKRSALFNVQYFPNPGGLVKKSQCHGMAEQLYGALELTEWEGSTYRGNGLRHEVVDDVLHFFCAYQVHLMADKPPTEKMQTLKQEVQHGS
jgi:hypothetical protein